MLNSFHDFWAGPDLTCCRVSSVCKGSPLGELHRCVQDRIRVKVHIRTFIGLRGVCSGFVVAFDKFWNMVSLCVGLLFILKSLSESAVIHGKLVVVVFGQAMVDVDETYREPLFGEAIHHEKALTVTRVCTILILHSCKYKVDCQSI